MFIEFRRHQICGDIDESAAVSKRFDAICLYPNRALGIVMLTHPIERSYDPGWLE